MIRLGMTVQYDGEDATVCGVLTSNGKYFVWLGEFVQGGLGLDAEGREEEEEWIPVEALD